MAKALAGRAAAVAGRNCLQVFGGIGFTTEHGFHRNYRRSLVLDRRLGDTRTLVIHPASTTHRQLSDDALEAASQI